MKICVDVGGTRRIVEVEESTPVWRVLQYLVTTLSLPYPAFESSRPGKYVPGEYVLKTHEGRLLSPAATLALQGVREGDILTLQPYAGDMGLYVRHSKALTAIEINRFLITLDEMVASASVGRSDRNVLEVVGMQTLENSVNAIILRPVEEIRDQWHQILKGISTTLIKLRDLPVDRFISASEPMVRVYKAAFDLRKICEAYEAVSIVLLGDEIPLGLKQIPLLPKKRLPRWPHPGRQEIIPEVWETLRLHPEYPDRHPEQFLKDFSKPLRRFLGSIPEISAPEKPEEGGETGSPGFTTFTLLPLAWEEPETASAVDPKVLHPELMKLERFPRVDFPARCVKGEQIPLRVQLMLHPQVSSLLKAISIPPVLGQQEVSLLITVHSRAFRILDDPYKIMRVPLGGDSELVSFLLTPYEDTQPGKHEITVGFFKGPQRVGGLVISTEISNPHSGGEASFIGGVGDNDTLFRESGKPFAPQATIMVSERVVEGNRYLAFDILTTHHRILPLPGGTTKTAGPDQGRWLDGLVKVLAQCATGNRRTREEYHAIWAHITTLGQWLANGIPQITREMIANLASNAGEPAWIQIYDPSHLVWMPWELIFAEGGFWGAQLVISRAPQISQIRNSSKYRFGKGLHCLASNISPDTGIVENARQVFAGTRLCSGFSLRPDLMVHEFCELVSGDNITLLHFTCHNDVLNGLGSVLCLGPDVVTNGLTTLVVESPDKVKLTDCALVFANSCASALIRPTLGHLTGFGEAFLRAGAASFIGTLTDIPVAPAIQFSRRFYQYLERGLPVGLALHYTRQEFANPTTGDLNPFWLFYSLYGNAEVSIEVRDDSGLLDAPGK